MAIDPICGMTVEPETAAGRFEYKGNTYYFCATSCLDRFRADPEKALSKNPLHLVTLPISSTTRKPLPMMMPAAPAAGSALDPVCGMTVQPETAAGSHVHEGKTYYFCATSCLTKFKKDPAFYLLPPDQRPAPMMSVPAGGAVEYICPMDPEILETKPGACRICGMALEPKVVTVEEGPNPELEDMSRRFR